jgi:uncharacterized UBP type Zn finger protein
MDQNLFSVENNGNTCYFGSTIILLLSNKKICECILQIEENEKPPKIEIIVALKEITKEIILPENQGKKYNLSKLYKIICKNSHFTVFRQEDAHELLQFLLGVIEDAVPKKETILDLFYYKYTSEVICRQCNHTLTNDNKESVMFLSLPDEQTDPAKTYADLINANFNKVEYLDDFTCEKCKNSNCVFKREILKQLPEVLFLCLRRFNYNSQKNKMPIKIDKKIAILGKKFHFYGSCIHLGPTIEKGHYIATIKNNIINDCQIIVKEKYHHDDNNSYIIIGEHYN